MPSKLQGTTTFATLTTIQYNTYVEWYSTNVRLFGPTREIHNNSRVVNNDMATSLTVSTVTKRPERVKDQQVLSILGVIKFYLRCEYIMPRNIYVVLV